MSEDLKYMGSTKKELWDAYKELKIKLAEFKAGEPVSTVAKALKEKVGTSIENATKIDVDSVENTLTGLVEGINSFKSQYDDLITAINAKKAELKEVHAIEVSANDLVALAAVKEQMIKDKEEEAERINTKIEKIREDADSFYSETINKAKEDALKIQEDKKRIRTREEEEYTYKTERNRRQASDMVNDELNEKSKSLDKRETEIKEREDMADDLNKKVEELTNRITDLEKSTQAKVDEALSIGEEKAKKSAQFQANMVKSHTDANTKIADAKIENLEEKVDALEAQIAEANKSVSDANEKVTSMAQSSLRAHGDAATIAEVSKIAAGKSGK